MFFFPLSLSTLIILNEERKQWRTTWNICLFSMSEVISSFKDMNIKLKWVLLWYYNFNWFLFNILSNIGHISSPWNCQNWVFTYSHFCDDLFILSDVFVVVVLVVYILGLMYKKKLVPHFPHHFTECKNFEAQDLETAHYADRTFQGDDMTRTW